MNAWEMPQVQALGEERLRLMQEAAEKCRGKSGMERLDIFLEYGGGGKPARTGAEAADTADADDGNLK